MRAIGGPEVLGTAQPKDAAFGFWAKSGHGEDQMSRNLWWPRAVHAPPVPLWLQIAAMGAGCRITEWWASSLQPCRAKLGASAPHSRSGAVGWRGGTQSWDEPKAVGGWDPAAWLCCWGRWGRDTSLPPR